MNPSFAHSLSSRYQLGPKIGEGASASVYEVYDRFSQQYVALKRARSPRQNERLQTEFLRLSLFRHPHIVSVFDQGLDSVGHSFFTQELISGGTLGDRAPHKDVAFKVRVLHQLLQVLLAVHTRGLVYLDLKPQNILWAGRGKQWLLRVCDFGLCQLRGTAASAQGTLPYMAPEVYQRERIDGRADLYSLGVLLYEWWAAEQHWRDATQWRRSQTQLPPELWKVAPGVPRWLSDIVMRMIQVNPTQRFSHAWEPLEILQRNRSRIDVPPPKVVAEHMMRAGTVNYRKDELADVEKWLGEQSKLETKVLAVGGEVGVGKTPFLRSLVPVLQNLGYRTLVHTRKSRVPLTRFFSEAFLPPGRTSIRDLARYFPGAPIAVMCDDVHASDEGALRFLEEWMSALSERDVLFVFSGDGPVESWAFWSRTAHRTQLGFVRKEDIKNMISARMQGLELPDVALDRMVADTGGTPVLVERTLARLLADGAVEMGHDGYRFVGGKYTKVRHVERFDWAERAQTLSRPLREVLEGASLFRFRVHVEPLAAVLQVDEGKLEPKLVELVDLGFLRLGDTALGPSYEWTSRSLRSTVRKSLNNERRGLLHDKAAEYYRGRSTEFDSWCEHALLGSAPEVAAEAALSLHRRDDEGRLRARTVEFLVRAFARWPNTEPSELGSALALAIASRFAGRGDWVRALDYAGLACSHACVGEASDAAAAILLGRIQLVMAQFDGLRKTMSRLRETFGKQSDWEDDIEALDLRLLLAEGAHEQVLQGSAETKRVGSRVLFCRALAFERMGQANSAEALLSDIDCRDWDASDRAEFAMLEARLQSERGAFSEAESTLRETLGSAERHRVDIVGVDVDHALGIIAFRRGALFESVELFQASLDGARRLDLFDQVGRCLHNLSIVNIRLGRLLPAVAASDEAFDIAKTRGDSAALGHAMIERGHIAHWMGEFRRSNYWLSRARKFGQERGESLVSAEAHAYAAWSFAWLGRAEHPVVQSYIDNVEGYLEHVDDGNSRITMVDCAFEILLRQKDMVRLAPWIEEYKRLAERPRFLGFKTYLEAQVLATSEHFDAPRHEEAADALYRQHLLLWALQHYAYHCERATAYASQLRSAVRAMQIQREIVESMPYHVRTHYLSSALSLRVYENFSRFRVA